MNGRTGREKNPRLKRMAYEQKARYRLPNDQGANYVWLRVDVYDNALIKLAVFEKI